MTPELLQELVNDGVVYWLKPGMLVRGEGDELIPVPKPQVVVHNHGNLTINIYSQPEPPKPQNGTSDGDKNPVEELRIKLGLTPEQMARELGCHPSSVKRWEKGTMFPRQQAILRSFFATLGKVDALGHMSRP